ncbi:hypothetical protein [Subtercola endophyticus]|uniref:hypothetical protein n=1 Tax=Subtercola endophyticus TaxID=2895559 RepID=UPI001E29B6DE|nr:hypothetical protein [Subtercola endophyticus]UFS58933.1 hypothetical protein LQ955_18380 [Subtercola endophyticus]
MGVLQSQNPDRTVRLESEALVSSLHLGNDPVDVFSGPARQAQSAVTAAYQVTERVTNALQQVAMYKNTTLTPEAVEAVKVDAQDVLLGYLRDRARTFDQNALEARTEAVKAAEPYKPKLAPNDLAQLTRTDQAWNNSVKPMLDDGKQWDQIVPMLDTDGLLAVQRFAPGHIALKEGSDAVPQTIAGINRMTANRLIDVAPEGDARTALQVERDTQKFADAARVATATLATVDAARNLITAGMSVKRVTFDVGAQPGVAAATAA